jgi:hypothetical protein
MTKLEGDSWTYSREDLEELFLKDCDTLDKHANEIITHEQRAQNISTRLSHLNQDVQVPAFCKNDFTDRRHLLRRYEDVEDPLRALLEKIEKTSR